MYTYFPGEEVYIYPSVNADDGGDLSTEKNLAEISDNLTFKNFIIDRELTESPVPEHNSFDIVYTQESMDFDLYSGLAVIAGRNIKFDPENGYVQLNLSDMISSSDVSGWTAHYNSTTYTNYKQGDRSEATLQHMSDNSLHLYLALLLDGTANVSGDIIDPVTEVRTCMGLALIIDEANRVGAKYYIDLGYFVPNSDSGAFISIYKFEENPLRYAYIDASSVQVGNETLEVRNQYINGLLGKVYQTNKVVSNRIHPILFRTATPAGTGVTDLNTANYSSKFYILNGGLVLNTTAFSVIGGAGINLDGGADLVVATSGYIQGLVKDNPFYSTNDDPTVANKTFSHLPKSTDSDLTKQGWNYYTVFVRFNGNIVDNPTINNIPIFTLSKLACPWYAISETDKTYILRFKYDPSASGTNPVYSWIIMNPTELVFTATRDHTSQSARIYIPGWDLGRGTDRNTYQLPEGFRISIIFDDTWDQVPDPVDPNLIYLGLRDLDHPVSANTSARLVNSMGEYLDWRQINQKGYAYNLVYHRKTYVDEFEVLNPTSPDVTTVVELIAYKRLKRNSDQSIHGTPENITSGAPEFTIRWHQDGKQVTISTEQSTEHTYNPSLVQVGSTGKYVHAYSTFTGDNGILTKDAYEYWYKLKDNQTYTEAMMPPIPISKHTSSDPGVAVLWMFDEDFIKYRAGYPDNSEVDHFEVQLPFDTPWSLTYLTE